MTQPILVFCAHGTRNDAGRHVILDVAQDVRDALGVEVREAYVDVQDPKVDAVVEEIEPGDGVSAVVVPYLLAGGYHVYHDIAEAVGERSDVHSAPALGPDARLIDIVMDRIREAGVHATATLVLAPAGSSDPRSQADTERTADMLRQRWDGPVRIGYAAGMKPSVAEAVASARVFGEDQEGGEVAVVSYLLSPGYFQDTLYKAGADQVTAPLAPDPRIVEIIADRYYDAFKP
ncbi:MAG: cobalamin biosynthesis protein CbiX [Actinobacteria bacterium HGW-Actinobacteria-4]|nr:MAG: cobalamin biosynthesis protein CbiX [Actinobacteria bacterium HGW-Actinobacteria-4]